MWRGKRGHYAVRVLKYMVCRFDINISAKRLTMLETKRLGVPTFGQGPKKPLQLI